MSSNAQIVRLSLSDSASLEYVLSDIPFFCVGLTALAVFTFFIVMRRVNLPAIYLYTSSLLAFGAAVLDLTQILLRGTTNTNEGLAMSTVTGIVNTREVGLSLAFGFRFLYLWAFVAQRPRYEPRPRNQEPSFEASHHSASWERWGALGLILKFALLGSVISIPILQIIWRIATGFSAVYVAESTIQIAVSVLLIAKLMLNLFLSTVAPWWRPFTPYIVPVFALLISTGVGAGNLLLFKFSETILGRFLQAVETYGLILSVLIFTFYKVSPTSEPRKRSSFFPNFSLKLEEPQNQVSAPTGSPVIMIGRGATFSDGPASRESHISRISSWINGRRPPRPNSGEQKLWNAGDAELGITTEMRATTPAASVEGSISPAVEVVYENRRPPLAVNTAAVEPKNSAPPTPTVQAVTPTTPRPFTGVSFASYYGMASNSRLTMPAPVTGDVSRNTESPVYGLNGIVTPGAPAAPASPESPILSRRPPSSPPPPASPSGARDSINSFDELLRQQTELDKSIAALRLFSPTTTVTPLPPPPPPPEELKSSADGSGRSISLSSNRSEFSLSIFPEPPPVDGSVLPDLLSLGRARDPPFPTGRTRRQSRIPRSAVSIKDGDGVEPEGILFSRGSPDRTRFDSAGTQYDVTSFIGDLMIPGSSEPRMGVLGEVAENESDMESPIISTATPGPALRPLLLNSAPSITSLPPATASSGLLPQQPTNYEYPVLKPLLLGSASGVPSPLSAGARRTPGPSVFNGPRRPAARPGQGRPVISVPQLEDEQIEEEAFEKPRRPPALTLER